MLNAVLPLSKAGFAIHWLKSRTKRPFTEAWSTEPVHTPETLTRTYRAGYNVGVRLGEPSKVSGLYLHALDLDIRDPTQGAAAREALKTFIPEYKTLPTVLTGSGAQSRHFYFLTDLPFRSKKVAHSGVKMLGADGKQHWTWEIELFGTGKQVAMPPSIHPDSGKPYTWIREFDLDELDMGLGPVIPSDRVAEWAGAMTLGQTEVDDDDDGLSAALAARPMDLTREEIHRTLYDLPVNDFCEDRDGWLTVGMALHHQFEGSQEGLNLWNEFSIRSAKYSAEDQARVWKSFQVKPGSTRMATLIKAATLARFAADDDDILGDGMDDDDLLGPAAGEDDDLLGPLEETSVRQDVDWISLLDLNDEGAIKPTLHNVELMVKNDARTVGVAQLNEFTQEVVLRAAAGRGKNKGRKRVKQARQLDSPIWTPTDKVNGDLWIDPHDYGVRSIFEAPKSQGGYGVKVSDRDLRAAVNRAAGEHSFHPVREYLERTTWDGVLRLDSLFTRYLGAEDCAYSRAVSRLTLLGAVVRIFEPGHKFDFVAIFEGLQGKRKSSFIEVLARRWFAEIEGNFEDRKAMVEKMQGSWILELPELQGFGRHEVQTIKAFISAKTDKVRLSYERRARDYKRQCIFIGSTNDSTYLRDDTGGRRFWPIACTVDEIDTEGLEAEVDQVWAEALALYRSMRKVQPYGTLPLYIADKEARAEAIEKQEQRRVETAEDALAGRITSWLDKPLVDETGFDDDGVVDEPVLREDTCLMEIWTEMMGEPLSRYNSASQQLLNRAMRRVTTWMQHGQHRFEKYGKQRVYRRCL